MGRIRRYKRFRRNGARLRHQLADRGARLIRRIEALRIQRPDVLLHSDELETALVRDDNSDGLAANFDNLLFHKELPPQHCRSHLKICDSSE